MSGVDVSEPMRGVAALVEDEHQLRAEALSLVRYLGHAQPSSVILDRFVAAVGARADALLVEASQRDLKEAAFVRKYGWALGALETAAALTGRDSILRRKAYLMSAILEATPEASGLFLDHPRSRLAALFALTMAGLNMVWRSLAGLLLSVVVWVS